MPRIQRASSPEGGRLQGRRNQALARATVRTIGGRSATSDRDVAAAARCRDADAAHAGPRAPSMPAAASSTTRALAGGTSQDVPPRRERPRVRFRRYVTSSATTTASKTRRASSDAQHHLDVRRAAPRRRSPASSRRSCSAVSHSARRAAASARAPPTSRRILRFLGVGDAGDRSGDASAPSQTRRIRSFRCPKLAGIAS